MATHFHVKSARLAVSDGDNFLRRSSDVQNSLGKISALLNSRVAKGLHVGSSSRKSPSVYTKKARKLRNASGSKRVKTPADVPSSGNDNIDVDAVKRTYCR